MNVAQRPGDRGDRRSGARGKGWFGILAAAAGAVLLAYGAAGDIPTPVPPDQRGRSDAERSGFHDANNLRTVFWNYGMVGDYPADPGNVDLSRLPLGRGAQG